jgi:ferredoxin
MTMPHEITRLRVDRIACTGHGVCAELLPELVTLDEWGYPLIAENGVIPARLARAARRAVTGCPALALSLASGPATLRGSSEGAQIPSRAGSTRLRT